MKKIYKFIPMVIIFFGLSFLSLSIYLFYPTPSFFWYAWHKKDINYLNELSQNLGLSNKLDERIRCWEATNSKCGIVLVFTTDFELETIKREVDTLNYEERLSRDIDGYGLISTIEFDTLKNLDVNGISDWTSIRNSINMPSGWGWWLINNKGRSIYINFFKPNPKDTYKIDGNELKGNILEVKYLTRGD